MSVVAVIFDFDDTLAPDTTSALLTAHGIDANDFWSVRARGLIEHGYDQPMAYLNLLLEEVRSGKLVGLNNRALADFGTSLDETWFPGLPDLFDDLQALVRAQGYRDISIEFYIISGGLQALVEGSAHVRKYFTGVYGCQLGENADGVVSDIKRCVTFTEKTRFLFEINKGIAPKDAARNPYLVNEFKAESDRAVPMRNMIYVGDGLTDVPCFSLVESRGGTPLGVLKRGGAESAKQTFQQLVTTNRVASVHYPDYRDSAELGTILRAAVATICGNIMLERARAL